MGFHVLVAYDGSDESENAVEYASEIGAAMDGSITVVYAVEPDVYRAASGGDMSNFSEEYRREILRTIDEAEEAGQQELANAASIAEEYGRSVTTELLYGDPINEVLEYAATHGVDMIVVGHRGRSERRGATLGSVAKTIVERASVPVTVTR